MENQIQTVEATQVVLFPGIAEQLDAIETENNNVVFLDCFGRNSLLAY